MKVGEHGQLTLSERKRAKDRIRRDADRERRAFGAPAPPMGRKPSHLLLILGFMVLVAVIMFARTRERPARRAKPLPTQVAESELQVLRIALERFRRDCNRYPAADEGLAALLRNPGLETWDGPYVNLTKSDPWKRRYVYEPGTNDITLLSLGPDGLRATPDDVVPEDWEPMLRELDASPETPHE